jgi:hypothetical protein
MRLIRRLENGELELTKNFDEEELLTISYAILSHTWSENNDDEISYEEFMSKSIKELQHEKPIGHAKLQFCAERIAEDRLEYFWIDTCCINRGSSEELGESITSMFSWYRNAIKCYVFLTDVSIARETQSRTSNRLSVHSWEPAFRRSRWFTRGWTLQELLAPQCVEFYSKDGFRIGDKSSLEHCIYEITGIAHRALRGVDLSVFSYEDRWKWFTGRQTRRTEDNAYCRLGIFNVSMIHNYGEGADHAMDRLREQIRRRQTEGDRRDQELEVLPLVSEATLDLRDPIHQPRCLPHTREGSLATTTGTCVGSMVLLAQVSPPSHEQSLLFTTIMDGLVPAFFSQGEVDTSATPNASSRPSHDNWPLQCHVLKDTFAKQSPQMRIFSTSPYVSNGVV